MTDTPISLAEIGGRDQIGRDWLAGRHSFELPDAKWLAVVTAEERDALVEAVSAAQAVYDLGETVLVEPAPEWNRLAAALSRFVSEQTPNGGKSEKPVADETSARSGADQ